VAAFSFNVALGREVELYNRVNNNDPANSAFIGVVLADATLESDALLKDYDTLSAVLATSLEATNAGYARVSWTDADLAAYTVDDSLDKIVLALSSKTFTTISPGDLWRKFVIGYDSDTTAGTDANIVPVKAYDMLGSTGTAIVPNGGDIICTWPDGMHVSS
jgi:hypothetical protein